MKIRFGLSIPALMLSVASLSSCVVINIGDGDGDVPATAVLLVESAACPDGALVGETVTCSITLVNSGDADIDIRATEITGDPIFAIGAAPSTVSANDVATIEVGASPLSAATFVATVAITSSAGDVSAELALTASAAPAPLLRVATDCDPLALRLEDVGRCSVSIANDGNAELTVTELLVEDADDNPVAIAAAGVVPVPFFVQPGTSATLDLLIMPSGVGPFDALVTLATNAGAASTAITGVVVNEIDVVIQLTWDTESDVDLRLIRADDEGRFCASGAEREAVVDHGVLAEDCAAQANEANDCGFENCRNAPFPDWDGDGVSSSGDPHLNIDSLTGTGPEQIVVAALPLGQYLVGVHSFDSAAPASVAFTVRVFVGGALFGELAGNVGAESPWAEPVVLIVGEATLCLAENATTCSTS